MKYKVFIVVLTFFYLSCAAETPKEATEAFEAVEKLNIATTTGTDPVNYNRFLIEARIAMDKARLKLPVAADDISDKSVDRNNSERRLMILNYSLEKAVQAYEDAKTIISITSQTSEIYYTPEGNRIMKKYGISESVTNPKEIIDRIWTRGDLYFYSASLHLRG